MSNKVKKAFYLPHFCIKTSLSPFFSLPFISIMCQRLPVWRHINIGWLTIHFNFSKLTLNYYLPLNPRRLEHPRYNWRSSENKANWRCRVVTENNKVNSCPYIGCPIKCVPLFMLLMFCSKSKDNKKGWNPSEGFSLIFYIVQKTFSGQQ